MNNQDKRNEYLKEREILVHLEMEAYRNFDKILLTLSSGAIALSVAFIDKVYYMFLYLIIFSWILWLVSIFLQLISLFITPKAMREEIIILNEQYKDDLKEPRKNKYSGKPSLLTFWALATFGLGTLLFIIFIILNLNSIVKQI